MDSGTISRFKRFPGECKHATIRRSTLQLLKTSQERSYVGQCYVLELDTATHHIFSADVQILLPQSGDIRGEGLQ